MANNIKGRLTASEMEILREQGLAEFVSYGNDNKYFAHVGDVVYYPDIPRQDQEKGYVILINCEG